MAGSCSCVRLYYTYTSTLSRRHFPVRSLCYPCIYIHVHIYVQTSCVYVCIRVYTCTVPRRVGVFVCTSRATLGARQNEISVGRWMSAAELAQPCVSGAQARANLHGGFNWKMRQPGPRLSPRKTVEKFQIPPPLGPSREIEPFPESTTNLCRGNSSGSGESLISRGEDPFLSVPRVNFLPFSSSSHSFSNWSIKRESFAAREDVWELEERERNESGANTRHWEIKRRIFPGRAVES